MQYRIASPRLMDHQDVTSSAIAGVSHDEDRDVLEVKFQSGRVYRYHGVPRTVFEEMLAAESAGKYFNEIIRTRYEGELVYDPRRPRVR